MELIHQDTSSEGTIYKFYIQTHIFLLYSTNTNNFKGTILSLGNSLIRTQMPLYRFGLRARKESHPEI